jgi:hypothetical protein
MRSTAGKFRHLQSFQLNLPLTNTFKWPQTAVKEHRHDVNVQLIGKPCFEALLCGACAAYHCDIFVARGRFCLSDGALYAIRHEGKS